MRKLNLVPADSNAKKNMLQHVMWASGSSVVLMVKVDKEKVAEHKMMKFRDHIDAHNKPFSRERGCVWRSQVPDVCLAEHRRRSLPC